VRHKARFPLFLLLAVILSASGCVQDYDIEEAASDEYMGRHAEEGHFHEHGEECDHPHDHDLEEHGTGAHSADERTEELETHEGHMHVHGAGERNHGTEWFFNQPWAARFVWGKIVRDSVILLLLAAAVYFIFALRRRGRE